MDESTESSPHEKAVRKARRRRFSRYRSIPDLLIESGLIALSVLLALAGTEWLEDRQRRERVERSLELIRGELKRNDQHIAIVAPYHLRARATILALEGAPPAERPLTPEEALRLVRSFFPQGTRPPSLSSAAWEAARARGDLPEINSELLVLLTTIYNIQEGTLRDSGERLLDTSAQVSRGLLTERGIIARSIGAHLEDVVIRERELRALYKRALQKLAEQER